jgi:hypothetical protein
MGSSQFARQSRQHCLEWHTLYVISTICAPAAKEIYEADRHAKKEVKKRVRGVREIEQQLTESDEPVAEVIEGYCLAVRSALTDDGVPPLDASGVKLHQRLNLIEQSLERVAQKGD